jgi:hypothetical protein
LTFHFFHSKLSIFNHCFFFSNTASNRIKLICVFYFNFFIFLDVLFHTFVVIFQWRQNMCHAIFHVCGFTWRKIRWFLHTFLGKTGWSSTSDINCVSFREWSASERAKRNTNFYHEWKITRAFPTTHVSTYFFVSQQLSLSRTPRDPRHWLDVLFVPLSSFFNDVKICVTPYFMYAVSHEGKYCTFNKN